MGKKYKKTNDKKFIKYIPLFFLVVVLMLTIGYSATTNHLVINNAGTVFRAQKEIRIADIAINSVTNQAVSNYENYSSSSIACGITLPNANSTVTYDVTIRNIGNIEMGVLSISLVPSELTYTINNYTIGDMLCDDNDNTVCKLGSVTTLNITVGYADGAYNGYDSDFPFEMTFMFAAIDKVAKLGNTYYDTLQKAVTAAPTDGSLVNIQLLNNVRERITITAGKNINFDFGNYILYNDGNAPVFENLGTMRMSSGTIVTTASQGAINVTGSSAAFMMTGGSIVVNGIKQAIYNDGGRVDISGSAYLMGTSNQRATVHNHSAGGIITILGGTIISTRFYGVLNEAGTLVIGEKDGIVDTGIPIIRGSTYGVNNSTGGNSPKSTYFSYYDGILEGGTRAIYNEEYIDDTEPTYGLLHRTQNIGGNNFDTVFLAELVIVTLDPTGGSVSTSSIGAEIGEKIGTLPTPTKTDYAFDGWYTSASGGTLITSDYIVTTASTFYAQWTHVDNTYVARIGTSSYHTLAEAIGSVTTSSVTTIELIRDTSENVTIPSGRRIILDMAPFTLTGVGDPAVIINSGTASIISGTIVTKSTKTSAINNTSSGSLTITGGSILASGLRQAVYNEGGKVFISGDAYLQAMTSQRATVQNHTSGGSIVITGGTIISPNFSAVFNEAGTLIVGTHDGNIDITTPILRGYAYGVNNGALFEFYDGILMGKNSGINGAVSSQEDNTTITAATQVVDGITYRTAYLS